MELHLSRSLGNTVLRDAQGMPRYRTESSLKWLGRTTIVSRFESRDGSSVKPIETRDAARTSETDIHLMSLEENEIARIEWRSSWSGWVTTIKFRNRTVKIDDYLTKDGFLGR